MTNNMTVADAALHVLVVDDDADARQNLRDILELDEFRVETAGTAAEVLCRDDLEGFFAILLDRKLPDGTAEELLPKLKARAPQAKVVIATGYADLESAVVALRLGASDYILKPINADALRASLRRLADQQRAETELRDRQARMRAILETAMDGIITIDSRGHIESFNPAAERMFGYSAAEVLGRNVSLLMTSPNREEHDEYLSRYLTTGERRIIGIGREVTAQRRDGSTFPVDLSVSEVFDDRRLFMGIVRDITDKKLAEERAMQSQRLAAIGQMVTGLAHESRNALQRSQACLELLVLELEGQPDALALVARVQKAQDHLHHLYEEVRGYAAPLKLHLKPSDLSEIWRETWSHLDVMRKDKEVTLREVADIDLDCQVDRHAIAQVLRNILENAIVACREPGEIVIRCAESVLNGAPALSVSVRDNGPGLNAEQRKRIFDPFYTTKTQGTGLGMAIAKRIVDSHAGRIEVGNPPEGAEILIVLPRGHDEPVLPHRRR
jgi:two-component system sensor kinase FixL